MSDVFVKEDELLRSALSKTTIRTTVYAADSMDIVSSTFYEKSSYLVSNQSCLESVTEDTVQELSEVFNRLNTRF